MKVRALSSRLGPLLLLFQRTPLVQWLLPEAKIAAGAGVGEITLWTAATVAGLGAYDSVAGASAITQLAPSPGSITVPAAKGSKLSFVFQTTGNPHAPGSWEVIGKLPAGLTHAGSSKSIDSITGTPAQSGTFPITLKAWENAGQSGDSLARKFTIKVGPSIITGNPASISIPSGGSATLTVTGNGPALAYQWFKGVSPNTSQPVSKATSATFKTPALTATTRYWVRVTRDGVTANSRTATVTVQTATTGD